MIFEQQSYRAGIYLRLSRDDDLQGESGSISTQRALITQFCKENNFKIADEYCDDGWSGTNFDRPDFQRMIEDIHAQNQPCVDQRLIKVRQRLHTIRLLY